MSANLYDHSTMYAEMRLRELRAAATEARLARLARQMRRPRALRRRLGRLLIGVGEALAGQRQVAAAGQR